MGRLTTVALMIFLTGCASGTMEVERCLPGELGCKKLLYSKYYRGEQMTQDGSLRLIVAAALGENDVPIAAQILYSVGANAETAPANKGNIKIYASNMTAQKYKLGLNELHVVMNDNNQRFKTEAGFELAPYETRGLTVIAKDIENFSTKFLVKAFLRHHEQTEEVDISVNRLSAEQLKQIQTLQRPL